MKKAFVPLLTCLMILVASASLLADGNQGQNFGKPGLTANDRPIGENDGMSVVDNVTNTLNDLAQDIQTAATGDISMGMSDSGCVTVDLVLDDTVSADNGAAWVDGSFEMTNCASEAAEILLTFELAMDMNGMVDTIIKVTDVPVYLPAGATVSHDFTLHFPPFEAVYTLCVSANSNGFIAEDCETVVVTGMSFPGIPFYACGVLYQGVDCLLFAPMGAHGLKFELENYGDFVAGDSVCVDGLMQFNCDSPCSEAVGCIVDNEIEAYDGIPDGIPFEGVGILVEDSTCLYFSPMGPNHQFVLDNYGGFASGDTVFVTGTLIYDCVTSCVNADGCIVDNTIEAVEPPPVHYSGCGVLVEGLYCTLFKPFGSQGDFFALENYGDFVAGDSVCIQGLFGDNCDPVCIDEATACVDSNTIAPFDSPDIDTIMACGVLVQGTDCVLFSPFGGIPQLFALDNYGDFTVGDSVCVEGMIDIDCVTDCSDADACVTENMISPFNDPGPGPNPFYACGVLTQGTDCVLFTPLGDSLGIMFALDNYGDFTVGDSVCVDGFVDYNCDTDCSDADACVTENMISPFNDPGPDPEFMACGYLVDINGCLLFDPYGGGPMGDSLYAELDDYGIYGAGDSVCVYGTIDPECIPACPEAMICVIVESIVGSSMPDSSMTVELETHNYPNPFNPSTEIEFSLNRASDVKLEVFNITGQKVEVLIDGRLEAGLHRINWDGSAYSSGIYLYRLQASDQVVSHKMILMK
ncbi:MAG: T9SS type A sorting domain-containing protein [candidate division Zixibacteria bacterium]|nr:T9SS type A sorting domain-containing protein [candidate division Zixibacteria bacterium]